MKGKPTSPGSSEPELEPTLEQLLPGLQPRPEMVAYRDTAAGEIVVVEVLPNDLESKSPTLAPRVRARFPIGNAESERDAQLFAKSHTMLAVLERDAGFLRYVLAETGVVGEPRPSDPDTWEGRLRRLVQALEHVQESLDDGVRCHRWVTIRDSAPEPQP